MDGSKVQTANLQAQSLYLREAFWRPGPSCLSVHMPTAVHPLWIRRRFHNYLGQQCSVQMWQWFCFDPATGAWHCGRVSASPKCYIPCTSYYTPCTSYYTPCTSYYTMLRLPMHQLLHPMHQLLHPMHQLLHPNTLIWNLTELCDIAKKDSQAMASLLIKSTPLLGAVWSIYICTGFCTSHRHPRKGLVRVWHHSCKSVSLSLVHERRTWETHRVDGCRFLGYIQFAQ